MKEIILPNNAYGIAFFLVALMLVAVIPYSITFWLVSMIAPLYVAMPVAVFASIITWLKLVKFNG